MDKVRKKPGREEEKKGKAQGKHDAENGFDIEYDKKKEHNSQQSTYRAAEAEIFCGGEYKCSQQRAAYIARGGYQKRVPTFWHAGSAKLISDLHLYYPAACNERHYAVGGFMQKHNEKFYRESNKWIPVEKCRNYNSYKEQYFGYFLPFSW